MDHVFVEKSRIKRPKIQDAYELNENLQIGRGSYGVVYKIHRKDQAFNKRKFYALKVIELLPYSPSACREISMYREVKHRNIMQLLQIFFSYSTKKASLLFDYAEYDLHSIIRYYRLQDKTMSSYMAKSCVNQILLGVEYLHNNWILHRDLKPENILLMGEGPECGCIKITDMGMARTFHSPLRPLADIDTVVVTCWYRAPELFLGSRHYTKAIDTFSVGCIFAELLTNVPIFHCTPESSEQHGRSPYQFNQLDKMFTVMGFPTSKDWEDLKQMPEYDKLNRDIVRSKYKACTLSKYMKTFSVNKISNEFKLLKCFLAMDPKLRIDCQVALKHIYFREYPRAGENAFSNIGLLEFPKRQFLAAQKIINGAIIRPVNR